MRTDYCGKLTSENIESSVTLCGWVHRRRDHGGLIFIDMRDVSGILQIVFDPERSGEVHTTGHSLRPEDVLEVKGTIAARPPDIRTPSLLFPENDNRSWCS